MRHAHDGAGGAHAADEVGDGAAGLLPDFGAGAVDVGLGVIRVGELVEDHPAAFVAHALGHVTGKLHAALLGGEHQLGAKGAHGLATLDALIFGHHQDHAVAANRRRHGQRDAGVAAGRFDQGLAGLDGAAGFGAQDHRQRRPILDRPRRVIALELGKDDVVAASGDPLEPDQRGLAHVVFERFEFHGSIQSGVGWNDAGECRRRTRQANGGPSLSPPFLRKKGLPAEAPGMRCRLCASRLGPADAQVGEAGLAGQRRIEDVAAVEDHRALELGLDGVEVRAAELLPLGDDHQRVGAVEGLHRPLGVGEARLVAEDAATLVHRHRGRRR